MLPESRKYLWDALRAADRIARYVAGRTFDDYVADDMVRSAVERQFLVVGEALGQMRRRDPVTAGMLPDIARIVGFRNVLMHNYGEVDERLVWGVIEGDLPVLRTTLRRLLGEP